MKAHRGGRPTILGAWNMAIALLAIIARQPGRPAVADVLAQIKVMDSEGVMC